MKTPTRWRRLFTLIFFGLSGAASLLVIDARISAEKRPTPPMVHMSLRGREAGSVFARMQIAVDFPAYLFADIQFPVPQLRQPSLLESKLGECELKILYFDAEGTEVTTAETPGPYAAVIEVQPPGGRVSRRYARIYRVAAPIDDESATLGELSWDELARIFAVSPGSLEREPARSWDRYRSRSLRDLCRDPFFARTISGVSLVEDDTVEARPWNDAMAAERRWWTHWKLDRNPLRQYVSPFLGPKETTTPPSPQLREGTLGEAGIDAETVAAVDSVLSEWANNSDQGFAVCIARRGIIVLHKAYGMRDGKPMTVTTKSWMASVTKAMSGTLMMMLVDSGRLTLDDRIADLLPPLYRLTSSRPITVRHLYTHTHGLEWWMKAQDEWPDLEERLADCYSFTVAGRRYNYNGTGYAVAGKVIEAVAQDSLPDIYRKHLLEPLGMEDTDVTGSYGDARSIPIDIARFGQMLLNGGTYGNKRFFRAPAYHAMLPRPLTSVLGPGAEKVWGIGLNGTPREFGHGAASSATFRINKEKELVVVITRNSAGTNFAKYESLFWETLNKGL